jgi:hypothetical protein
MVEQGSTAHRSRTLSHSPDIALTPSASEMAEMFERYETGDRDWGIVCFQWMEREFWQLFEGIELIPVVVDQK